MKAQVSAPAKALAPFTAAREQFEQIVGDLESDRMFSMTHGDVEEHLRVEGFELLRRLFQGHLDARGPGEAGEAVVGADGVARTHRRQGERQLMTIFGEVTVRRLRYGGREMDCLIPLDAGLNLPVEHHSHGVRRRVAVEAARGSFDDAVAAVCDATAATVGKRQAEGLTAAAVVDFDAFYTTRAVDETAATGSVMVLSADGKGVVMRPEDLRPATRAAARGRRHKLKRRLCRGEKRSTKRMATVATVFTTAPFVRRPVDIIHALGGTDAGPRRPKPEHKRVWASLAKSADEVIHEAFEEAERRDPRHTKRWVALVDGNKHQIRVLRREAAVRGIDLTIVLDIIHVIEYLWKAAHVFFAEGDPAAEAWVTERLLIILHGRPSAVAGGIRRSATRRHLKPEDRAAVDDCADYLVTYKRFMDYKAYLADGLPIATGVIEGACRHLVNDRMDITGARWGLDGAEAVLRLRALKSSGDLDDYWSFHLDREHERRHRSRFKGGAIPAVIPFPSPQPLPAPLKKTA
jgi:hypothetical protein